MGIFLEGFAGGGKKEGQYVWEKYAPLVLPSGYKLLDSIKSTGAQYIDFGFAPKKGYRAEIVFRSVSTPALCWIFGVTQSSGNWRAGFAGGSFHTGGGFTYSQTSSLTERTVAKGTCPSDMSGNVYLFAGNENGAIEFGSFELEYCKVWDANDNLIRFAVASENPSGVVGLYDCVNGVFYKDPKGKTFTAGNTADGFGVHKIFKNYVVDEKLTAYPNGGEQDGYWYELSEGADLAEIFAQIWGYTKCAIDKNTFSSASQQPTFKHSLGEIPKFFMVVDANPASRANNSATFLFARRAKDGSKYFSFAYVSNGNETLNTANLEYTPSVTQIALNSTTGGYPFRAGVEYNLITMA